MAGTRRVLIYCFIVQYVSGQKNDATSPNTPTDVTIASASNTEIPITTESSSTPQKQLDFSALTMPTLPSEFPAFPPTSSDDTPASYPPKQPETIDNTTLPSERQLLEFKLEHPKPIGLLTIDSGAPVDVRDTISFNSDLLRDDYFFDIQSHVDGQRVPNRNVLAKGTAVWGYFEVTHDISNYTSADVFNGIGKKTKVLGRFSSGIGEKGVSDVTRDAKAFAVKFYTKEGNLDILNLHTPVFLTKDPVDFLPFVQAGSRNPHTNLPDLTALADIITLRPDAIAAAVYLTSDRGIPDGWRHADFFPIHTYELNNKYGDRWYVRFNFRTEQGLRNLTLLQTLAIQSLTPDYYIRDLYNNLEFNNTPSWRLEMDVLSLQDVQKVNYNPFDVTRLWDDGTFKTLTIGRLTLNKISENHFRDQEQAAFDPTNLVPGIPGPVDTLFRGRRFAYRDAQNYRISRNFNKVGVNLPIYAKSYIRDGHPPVLGNGKDSLIYYPNSFNGPLPFVNEERPQEQLMVYESNAIDLQVAADLLERFSPDEAAKTRQALNLASLFVFVTEPVRSRALRLIFLISPSFFQRFIAALDMLQRLLAPAQAFQAASFST